MSITNVCPSEDCHTLGVDANDLDRYADIATGSGDLLVYDREEEDAWIQSDTFVPRDDFV